MKKKINCCICNKEIDKEETIRLSEQKYGIGRYAWFSPTGNKFNFCEKCYIIFLDWRKENAEKK